jgi:hypothetical protein
VDQQPSNIRNISVLFSGRGTSLPAAGQSPSTPG